MLPGRIDLHRPDHDRQLPVDAARARIHQPVTHERDRACGLIGGDGLAAQLQPRLWRPLHRGHRHPAVAQRACGARLVGGGRATRAVTPQRLHERRTLECFQVAVLVEYALALRRRHAHDRPVNLLIMQ